jgi:hypothetical protein
MKIRTLYLETSIFGFWSDRHPVNREKRVAVRKLLQQIHAGRFRGIVSALVVRELEQWSNPAGLGLLRTAGVDVVATDPEEVETVAQRYVKEAILTSAQIEDARHVASATILDVDALVSLNLRHIANTWRVRGFNAINLRLGYRPLTVATPQEVIDEGP